MLALAGRVCRLGTAFPSRGQLWNLLSELSLFSGSLFHSAARFRATTWPGTRHGLKEQRAEVWGHAALQLPGAPCKLFPHTWLLQCEMAISQSYPAQAKCPGTSGPSNAFILSRVVAWPIQIDLIAQLPNTSSRPSCGLTQWTQAGPKAGLYRHGQGQHTS